MSSQQSEQTDARLYHLIQGRCKYYVTPICRQHLIPHVLSPPVLFYPRSARTALAHPKPPRKALIDDVLLLRKASTSRPSPSCLHPGQTTARGQQEAKRPGLTLLPSGWRGTIHEKSKVGHGLPVAAPEPENQTESQTLRFAMSKHTVQQLSNTTRSLFWCRHGDLAKDRWLCYRCCMAPDGTCCARAPSHGGCAPRARVNVGCEALGRR